MIRESFDKAEQDMRERQVREARLDADNVLAATEKAKRNPAWRELSGEERSAVDNAIGDIQNVYHSGDHDLIGQKIEALNQVTTKLAETMMNTAVRGALRGTKID